MLPDRAGWSRGRNIRGTGNGAAKAPWDGQRRADMEELHPELANRTMAGGRDRWIMHPLLEMPLPVGYVVRVNRMFRHRQEELARAKAVGDWRAYALRHVPGWR